MARVELQTQIVGKGFIRYAGDVYECDSATARRLIDSGQAIPAEAPAGIECATSDGTNRSKGPRHERRGKGAK